MYDNWVANAVVVGATAVAVTLCVLMHYEGLVLVFRGLCRLHARHQRVKILYTIMAVLALHVLEVWIFGVAYWLLLKWPDAGWMAGPGAIGLFDTVYLSAMTFTTVGYGDVAPLGPIRFLAGTEALTGLVLITWSASFTYLEMDHYWRSSARSPRSQAR